ncbi:hypothetical protein GCM10023107_84700 [Actinoplanes octamycinicus]|nr:hypothetical protein Aoc01nite_66440 [Actinoplanes octamycinicus]
MKSSSAGVMEVAAVPSAMVGSWWWARGGGGAGRGDRAVGGAVRDGGAVVVAVRVAVIGRRAVQVAVVGRGGGRCGPRWWGLALGVRAAVIGPWWAAPRGGAAVGRAGAEGTTRGGTRGAAGGRVEVAGGCGDDDRFPVRR